MDSLASGSGLGSKLPPRGEKRTIEDVEGSKSPNKDGSPDRKKGRFDDNSDSEGEGKTILEQYRSKMERDKERDKERQKIREDKSAHSDEEEVDYSDSPVHSEEKKIDEDSKKLESAIADDMQKIIELSKKLRVATKKDSPSEHSEFEEHLRGMRDDLRALKSTREALKGNIARLEGHQNDSDTVNLLENIKSELGEPTEREKNYEVKIREMVVKSIDDRRKRLNKITTDLYYDTTSRMNSHHSGFKNLVQRTEANLEEYSAVKKGTLDRIEALKGDDDIDEDTKNALDNKKDDINGDSGRYENYHRRLGQMQQALKIPLMNAIRIKLGRLSRLNEELDYDTAGTEPRMSNEHPGHRTFVENLGTKLNSFGESISQVNEDIAYMKKISNLDTGVRSELTSFEKRCSEFIVQMNPYASAHDRMDKNLGEIAQSGS